MIFQADLTIKTAIELGIQDLKDNLWLIDDILGDTANNPYLQKKYSGQIAACKEWFKNNEIDVYMRGRNDRDRYPNITITLGTSNEKVDMESLGQSSWETVALLPQTIGKSIPYVMAPFEPNSYNAGTGELSVEDGTPGLHQVAVGQILVDPQTGNGYVIQDITPNGFELETGLTLSATLYAVVPKNQFYKARIEHSFFQETYNISCNVHGDPQTVLWLHSIVLYSLLRYRESLLEANGLAESLLTSSDLVEDQNFSGPGGERAFTRIISLTGQVENSWIKSPRRVIEKVVANDTGNATTGFMGGIKIISNLDSQPQLDTPSDPWTTIDDDGGDEEEQS